jgi:hypothetical protein
VPNAQVTTRNGLGVRSGACDTTADIRRLRSGEQAKPRIYFRGNVLNYAVNPIAEGLLDGWKGRSPFVA